MTADEDDGKGGPGKGDECLWLVSVTMMTTRAREVRVTMMMKKPLSLTFYPLHSTGSRR
jgi:hypothetical protein